VALRQAVDEAAAVAPARERIAARLKEAGLGGTAADQGHIDITSALVARVVEIMVAYRQKRSATLQEAVNHARQEVFDLFPTMRQIDLVEAIAADPELDTATPKQIAIGAGTALGKTSKIIEGFNRA
jgi:hypothetical protein